MEAIVSSDYRQSTKGAAPAVEGALLDHAVRREVAQSRVDTLNWRLGR